MPEPAPVPEEETNVRIKSIPAWMQVAFDELGVKEVPGDGDNPRIVEYHQATTLKATDDEVPWCSAFVNWVMREAGYMYTRSAAARSWLTWGDEIELPVYGAVTVLRRGNNPAQGHVGFFVDQPEAGVIRLLGGNQSDSVNITVFPASRVIGYRWPSAEEVSHAAIDLDD